MSSDEKRDLEFGNGANGANGANGNEKTMVHTPVGDSHAPMYENHTTTRLEDDYEGKPTEEELNTLPRVAGNVPNVAYMICIVEFCERASYYGIQGLISNYVNRPLPPGGNGYGAPARGTQDTGGALNMGTAVANAVGQSFSLLAYTLPLVVAYFADTKTGRFKMIFWGVLVFGIGHTILVASGAKNLLANGQAKIPYFIGLYIIAVGAAMFKPCVSPILLDQVTNTRPVVILDKKGERVIQDPESTTERVMLWFYLLINIGGFMQVATSYCEKYVGWWLAYLIPLLLYLPLPLLLWFLKPRLILHAPGGSDMVNVFRVLGVALRGGRIGRKGFWDAALPDRMRAAGYKESSIHWNDQFVDDVRRTFQATGIFCFCPIQAINDQGIGSAASFQSTMLTTNGVPNDVINNFNSLSIIVAAPILNYALYPALRKAGIHYGAVARMTTGLAISTIGGVGYAVLQYYAYQQSPCGYYGSDDCTVGTGVAPISIWYMAIPYAIGGISELFINVPAYGIAYSRAPVNMRGLVSALNLLSQGVVYIIGLACSSVIVDPHLIWDFGGPAIAGAILTVVFWFTFKHIDKEEYVLSQENNEGPGELALLGTGPIVAENALNKSDNRPAPIGDNEQMMISQKQ